MYNSQCIFIMVSIKIILLKYFLPKIFTAVLSILKIELCQKKHNASKIILKILINLTKCDIILPRRRFSVQITEFLSISLNAHTISTSTLLY
jgi:hypothetical protein